MKKFAIYAIVTVVVLAIAGSVVLAAPGPRGPMAGEPPAQPVKLTDTQKAELAKIEYQMLDLKKQELQVYVKAGVMTQEVANAHITLMKAHLDEAVKNGTIGIGFGHGGRPGPGGPQGQEPLAIK